MLKNEFHKMMNNSIFFILFFILYIPFAQQYYELLDLQWADEALAMLLGLHFLRKSSKGGCFYYSKELKTFLLIILFYILYSIVLNKVVIQAIFFDVLQQFKPYITFYATISLKPHFNEGQRKFMKKYILALFIIYLYVSYSTHNIATAYFGQSCLISCILYWYFSNETKKDMTVIFFIMTCGLLCTKSKFYGEYIVFIFLIFFLHKKFKLESFKTLSVIASLAIIIIFFTWKKFSVYYIDGFSQDAEQELARPISYMTGLSIIKDYFPFGSGLGSFSVEAARAYYSPIYYEYEINNVWGLSPDNPDFLADAFYPSLAEIGIVGTFFFLCFWWRRYKNIYAIHNLKNYKVAILCASAILLESIADTTYLSGPGMCYFMLMALNIKANINMDHMLQPHKYHRMLSHEQTLKK